MFINGKSIVYIVLLNIIAAQIIQEETETGSLINQPIIEDTDKQSCPCLNNGQCYSPSSDDYILTRKKEVFCRCPSSYIGKFCQFEAFELSGPKQISSKINIHKYKYFYYEPMEQNMYSFSFDLCFDNKTPSKLSQQKPTKDQISFFITTQNQDGAFQIDQQVTQATTVSFQSDQCKQISIDYTVLLITKLRTIQKLIFAIKLGEKLTLNATKNDKDKQNQIIREQIKTVQKQIKRDPSQTRDPFSTNDPIRTNDNLQSVTPQQLSGTNKIAEDYHPISYNIYSQKKKSDSLKEQETTKKENTKNINDFKSKSPSKLKEEDDSNSKNINITFTAYPFMVEFVVFNILFSLTTLAAFIIVGIMIFIIRSRILGIALSSTLGISSRLINDLSHFDRYIPEQKFIKKQKKQGDISPNSSQIECAICLVKFQQMDRIRRTPCSHSFHKSCIDAWCHQNLTCPMCRKSLTEKNMMDFFNSTALELKNSPQSDQ